MESVVSIWQRVTLAFLLVSLSGAFAFGPAASAQQEPQLCFGEVVTIIGTEGDDDLRGTSGRDVIQALGGDDEVEGRGGNDVICGDAGDDELEGGRGNDLIQDETGDDEIDGGPGNDRLFGNLGDDEIDGGRGDDVLLGGTGDEEDFYPGRDRLKGGPGNDLLNGGHGDDVLFGGRGDDELEGYLGEDRLEGGPGSDVLRDSVGAGNDLLLGGRGDDEVHGGEGNDELFGGPGNDALFGEDGDDELSGGRGDDLLDGGPGEDDFDGGPGNDTIVDEPPPPPPPSDTLSSLIDAGDRAGIRAWAAVRSIATLNSEVTALDQAHRDQLAEVLLDTNATGENRDKMLRVIRTVLARPDLGFYAENWSYTFIELTGGGFFGTCNHLFLSPDAWAGLSDQDATGVLMHETFHSFNCVNGGPAGSLDEGSSIWVVQAGLGQPLIPGQSFAETTYGTKLYYRDLAGNPDFPLGAPASPSPKLIDVYTWLSANDPSQLPWNSTERLVACFDRYFVTLDRNVDFFNVWLPSVKERTDLMLADAECKPL